MSAVRMTWADFSARYCKTQVSTPDELLVEQDTRAASTLITGRRCPQRSWEKCAVWILSNGWTAWEQYGYYGPYLSSLEAPDGKHWQASNGSPGDQYSIGGAAKANAAFRTDEYIDLPEFAVPWRDADKHKLVRPKFKKECT